jgi:hypothetical protein
MPGPVLVESDPIFTELREDPEFQEIVESLRARRDEIRRRLGLWRGGGDAAASTATRTTTAAALYRISPRIGGLQPSLHSMHRRAVVPGRDRESIEPDIRLQTLRQSPIEAEKGILIKVKDRTEFRTDG